MQKSIGERIVEMLEKRNMTQKKLAQTIGLNEATLSRYISGERTMSSKTLANIATALHTTSDFLLGIEGYTFSFSKIERIIAKNANNMTTEEKKDLISALFGEY